MYDYNNYQKSISKELISIKDRVRNFIGKNHWGEDGRYKEIILRDIIVEKLPKFASCGTGFVIGTNQHISTQIDIIVYRNDMPMLFKNGDFIIAPQEAVLGLIEVKTRLHRGNIEDTIKKAHENGNLIENKIFNGIFSYDNYLTGVDSHFQIEDKIRDLLCNYSCNVNYISFGKDYFLKYWEAGQPYNQLNNKYRLYKIEDLAFGYFISNLIEDSYIITQGSSIPETLKAVLYPIERTKEAHIVDTLLLE